MNCLVIAATTFEIAPFLQQYRGSPGTFRMDTDVLITGVGLTAATYSITKQISIKKPDLIIQAGIAGAIDRRLAPGVVVAVKKELVADQGVMEKGKWQTLFDMKFLSANERPYYKKWLVNPSPILRESNLKKVSGITINSITTSRKTIDTYTELFQPGIESMEGAALHYVALMENISFIQLRAISNYAGERNKKNWKINESITNLNIELIKLLNTV